VEELRQRKKKALVFSQKVTLLTEVSRFNLPHVDARISDENYQSEIQAIGAKNSVICAKNKPTN
jgi:hypothetical protein